MDEADALTNDSQYALRRIIDDYSHSTRFIIICNYLNKLINPIISRFRAFQFKQISLESANKILHKIIKKEKLLTKKSLIFLDVNFYYLVSINYEITFR